MAARTDADRQLGRRASLDFEMAMQDFFMRVEGHAKIQPQMALESDDDYFDRLRKDNERVGDILNAYCADGVGDLWVEWANEDL